MGIFSAIGSFLFGGNHNTTGSRTNTTSTGSTTEAPYYLAIPQIQRYLENTDAMYNGPNSAPLFSDLELRGYNRLENDIAADQNHIKSAIRENDNIVQGKYLTPDTNPYLADIAKRVSGIAGSNVNATFGGRGRSSGGLAGYYAGKGIADSANELYGAQYDNERGRQMQAIDMVPELDRTRYNAPQAMISAGQNISARPYDINTLQGTTLANIGRLGGQTTSNSTGNSTTQNYANDPGLIGRIANSFTNKLFGV